MAIDSKLDSSTNRALWVIAFALLTIAICLVVLVLQTQLEPKPVNAPRPVLAAPPAAPKPNLPAILRNPPRVLPPPPPRAQAQVAVNPETTPADTPPIDAEPPPPTPVPTRLAANPGALASLAGLAQDRSTGEIVGKVILHGKPPLEKLIVPLNEDRVCGPLQSSPAKTRFFIVSSEGGLADVLVFIRNSRSGQKLPTSAGTHELQFTNCLIEPYISAVQRGQKIVVRDSDPLSHSVHFTPARNKELNFPLRQRGDATRLLGFFNPEMFVTLRCDLHPWEFAYVSVLDHPFFAVTDKSGAFAITNVPPGNYVLEALHRKANGTNGVAQQITVRAAETAAADFSIEAPAP